jgi:hypothetical protein
VATDPILLELRNAVYLQRVGNTITAEAARALEDVFADIAAEIQRIDPGGVSAAVYRRARLERLFRRIDEILPPGIKGISKDLRERLARLGRDQALWTAEGIADAIGPLPSGALVQVSTGALTANYFKAILDTDPFGGPDVADTLEGWMSGLTQRTRVRIRRELCFLCRQVTQEAEAVLHILDELSGRHQPVRPMHPPNRRPSSRPRSAGTRSGAGARCRLPWARRAV